MALAAKHLRLEYYNRSNYIDNVYEFGFEVGIFESSTITNIKKVTEAVVYNIIKYTLYRLKDIDDNFTYNLRVRNSFLTSTSLI